MVLAGPRGIGKTATLNAFADLAKQQGFETVNLQAVGGHGGLMAALLQEAQSRAASAAPAWRRSIRAFERLGGVNVSAFGFGAGVSLDNRPAPAPAPDIGPGSLANALASLANEVRRDAPNGGLLLTVDELQVASPGDIALLAAGLHRLNVDYPHASVLFAATGLPHVMDVVEKAGVTHPDRLFVLEPLPLALPRPAALFAITEPARLAGVLWEDGAAEAVAEAANGYPAHIQFYAHEAWKVAAGPFRITRGETAVAIPQATQVIRQRSLEPRWTRMSGRQRELTAALALVGRKGPNRRRVGSVGAEGQAVVA
jgi:hypothetical protein